ncbi:MAG: serine hydrolase domain-containing protein [Victivallaceae bacterium]
MKLISVLLSFAAASSLTAAELTDWKIAGPLPEMTVEDSAPAKTRAAKFIAGDLGETQTYSAKDFPGKILFHEIWDKNNLDNRFALAATVIKVDKPGYYRMAIAHDGDMDLFINGNHVYTGRKQPEYTQFFVELSDKDNLLTFKNTHSSGPWSVRICLADGPFTKEETEILAAKLAIIQDYKQFGNSRPYINGNSIIPVGEFGKYEWTIPSTLTTNLSPSWLDADLNQVEKAEKPGLYYLKIAGTVNGNIPYLRYFPFYAVEENWQESSAIKPYASLLVLDPWKPWLVYYYPLLLDNIYRGRPLRYYNLPMPLLSRRADRFVKKLAPPEKRTVPAPVLRSGTELEAGVPDGTAAKLDAIMSAWYRETGEPFHTIFARNGVIFYSKSYGNADENRVCNLASISKFFTGLLYARFLDQGILDLDRPMSNMFPTLPPITPRHCFTHMCGLSEPSGFGDLSNVWLDMALAPVLETSIPGVTFKYNDAGYNLLGLQMMAASGTPNTTLYQENFYNQLVISDMTSFNQYNGFSASTVDLAKFAQLMLNHGSYGDWKFFGEDAYRKMLPVPLIEYFPKCQDQRAWGMGLTFFGPEIEGRQRVIGHGAGSGSLFMLNPDADAFIVQAREKITDKYPKYSEEIFKLLAELK